jgi:hypothetical protein
MPSPNDPFSTKLVEASVQEIQLELLRRSSFNALNGPRVVERLRQHRDLWLAVILDRIGICGSGRLPMSSLIKLRDLHRNIWNADTLYILTRTTADAKRFAEIIRDEDWAAEVYLHDDTHEISDLLGTSFKEDFGLIRVWWD